MFILSNFQLFPSSFSPQLPGKGWTPVTCECVFVLGALGSGDEHGDFEHLEEISLTKHRGQTCPATKHHHKIEEYRKNYGGGRGGGGKWRIFQTLGRTCMLQSIRFSGLVPFGKAAESSPLWAQDTMKDPSTGCNILQLSQTIHIFPNDAISLLEYRKSSLKRQPCPQHSTKHLWLAVLIHISVPGLFLLSSSSPFVPCFSM